MVTNVKTGAVGAVDKEKSVYAFFIALFVIASGVSLGIGTGSMGVAFGVAFALFVLISVIIIESEKIVDAIRESKK